MVRRRRSPGLMALEPRVMYDGAAAAGAAAATHHYHHADAGHCESPSALVSGSQTASTGNQVQTPCATPPPEPGASSTAGTSSGAGQQIVFIDSNVPDAQLLAQGVQPGITVVMLDPNSNGSRRVAAAGAGSPARNILRVQNPANRENNRDFVRIIGSSCAKGPVTTAFSGPPATHRR